jgi:hypothetical protein
MEPNQAQNPQETIDGQPSAETASVSPQVLKHEKVLIPLDSTLRPEGLITPVKPPVTPDNLTQSAPAPTQTVQPQASQPMSQPNPDAIYPNPAQPMAPSPPQTEIFNGKKYWAGKIIKLIVTSIIGFFLTGIYFYSLDAGDILDRARAASRHYSPLVLGDSIVFTLVLIAIYAALLLFILRSRNIIGQSAFSIIASQLLALLILSIEHFGDHSINIFGSANAAILATIVALIGAAIFAGTNFFAEKVWTWRLSRSMLAVTGVVALSVITFGVSQLSSMSASRYQKQQAASVAKAQKEAEVGVYDFSGGYQQFYLKDSVQSRFEISALAAYNKSATEKYGAPHYTLFTLRDKSNDRVDFTLWQTKATTGIFKPPSLCGNPDPKYSYNDSLNKRGIYVGACTKLQDIPGVGTLYGRDEDDKYGNNTGYSQREKEQAAGLYEWYYIKYGDTLLTIEDNRKTLGTEGAANIFSNLNPVSSADLLIKSKQLASAQTAVKSSALAISFPLYTPSNTLGLSLILASLTNKTDPSNPVILFKYDDSNSLYSTGFIIHEYKRPQKFNPPYCGYEAPGAGDDSDPCKSIGNTSSGKIVYSSGHFYWGDFGDTIISLSGVSSKTDALSIYESMVSVSLSSLNLE